MGGDTLRYVTSEDESSLDNEYYQEFPLHHPTFYRDDDESFSGSNGFVPREFDEVGSRISSNPVEFDGNLRRRKIAYKEIMRNYDELWTRRETLYQAKCKVLRYSPGSWISNAGGTKRSNYVVPKTTTLLLIGPKGSGKSSLVNRISRVFEDDKLFASERAQVTYNSSTGDGTFFLQEYMIPRGATSFCLFDTRSLSEKFADNDAMLQHWMTKGVRHGELVIRDADSSSLKMALKCKAQHSGSPSSEIRKVNFVMFVVNGFSVLRAMNSEKKEDRGYMELVTETFSCPYLSFKDDKPVIVVTHGDLLSLGDRARVRVYLGEKLGVPPAKQIFDIPDNSDPSTELTIVDMIKHSLEHADKNLPRRESREWVDRSVFSEDTLNSKVFKISILASIFLAILLGIACVAFPMHQSHKHDSEPVLKAAINWHTKSQVNQQYETYEPLITSPPNSKSKSAVNHSHENQGHQNHEPEPKSRHQNHEPEPKYRHQNHEPEPKSRHQNHEPEPKYRHQNHEPEPKSRHQNHEPEPKSRHQNHEPEPNSRYQNHEPEPNSRYQNHEPEPKSEHTLPEKSDEATSVPTLSSKDSINRPWIEDAKSRSRSPESRHPKSAVKWHKIRHLWLHSD